MSIRGTISTLVDLLALSAGILIGLPFLLILVAPFV
jgi:hypothetical protein